MKVSKLKEGDVLEPGDWLQKDDWTGKRWYKVERVTAKFAVVRWSDTATSKFQREIGWSVRPCGEKDIWSRVRYSFWRPVQVKEEKDGNVQNPG